MLLRAVLRMMTAIIVLPIVFVVVVVAMAVAGLAFTLAVLAPLAPFIVVGVVVYLLMRRSPAATAHPN